eukprot:g2626.t1 g2626   contig12:492567-494921(+)
MPSPSRRQSPRRGGSAKSSSLQSLTAAVNSKPTASRSLNTLDASSSESDDDEEELTTEQAFANANAKQIGKRTGVTLPPRGEIPMEKDSHFEDADAFWDAAKSPAPGSSSGSAAKRSGKGAAKGGHGKKGEVKRAERERIAEQQRVERMQFEEASRKNALKKPDLLNTQDDFDDDDDDDDGDNNNSSRKAQQTPKPAPGWSNRLLHKAMGIPTGDSPANTVLSKVSTAPPSTGARSSISGSRDEFTSTSVKHALRRGHVENQLDTLGRDDGEGSPAVVGGEVVDEKGMDPPEEVEALQRSGGGGGRGVDPEELEDAPEDPADFGQDNDQFSTGGMDSVGGGKSSSKSTPTEALESGVESMMAKHDDYDDDNEGGSGMQLHTQEEHSFDNNNDYDDDLESHHASQKSKSSKGSATEGSFNENVKPNKKKAKKDEKSPVTPTSVLRTKKSKKKKTQNNRVNWSTPNGHTGMVAGNREYEAVPVTDYKEEYAPGEEPRTPGGTEIRRSHRARFKPLQFWKNEKLIYEAQNESGLLGEAMGDMPVVSGVHKAKPTPYKERKVTVKPKQEKNGKRRRGSEDDDEEESSYDGGPNAKNPFDPKTLGKKYQLNNGEHGSIWSETLEDTTESKVVSRLDNRSFSKLPLSNTRKKKESKVVGFASQAFHVPTDQDDLFPGYISGNVVLPPRGIKDAEGVGLCSQVFNVGDCQPNSLEFALADPTNQDGEFNAKTAQRYLLSKGDMFQIPPGNVYRIENHSKTDKACLFWTIIKCTSRAEAASDGEGGAESDEE